MSKYGHRTNNWFEAIVNKLGGEDAAEKFLRDELTVSEPVRAWEERDGVIYFTVTFVRRTGEEWILYLKSKGFRVSDYAKSVLRSSDFKSTNGVTYNIAVLKGMLFQDSERVTKNIRAKADRRKLTKPNAEVACLIREKFTDKELEAMGFWRIVAMHEPINDSNGVPRLLFADRDGGGRWLSTACGRPGDGWGRGSGFAFVVSQVSAQDSATEN